jgi:hypothetical protein
VTKRSHTQRRKKGGPEGDENEKDTEGDERLSKKTIVCCRKTNSMIEFKNRKMTSCLAIRDSTASSLRRSGANVEDARITTLSRHRRKRRVAAYRTESWPGGKDMGFSNPMRARVGSGGRTRRMKRAEGEEGVKTMLLQADEPAFLQHSTQYLNATTPCCEEEGKRRGGAQLSQIVLPQYAEARYRGEQVEGR